MATHTTLDNPPGRTAVARSVGRRGPVGPRIVVVDDQPEIGELIGAFLRDYPDVAIFTRGEDALEHIESRGADLLLTDLEMPGVSGIELIRRARDGRPDLSCIVVSGRGTTESSIELIRCGVCDYLEKPFTSGQVTDAVERAWEARRLRLERERLFEELRQAGDRLREEDERIRCLLAMLGSLIVIIAPDGRVVEFNSEAERVFGIARADVIGRSYFDLLDDEQTTFVEEALGRRVLAGETVRDYETRRKSAGGETLIHRWQVSRMLDASGAPEAVVAIGRDVTESYRRDREVRRLVQAVEQANDSIVIADLEGRIAYANPVAERVTGYSHEELRGTHTRIFKSGRHDAAFYRELWATVLGGGVWRGRMWNRRKDGSLIQEDATISGVRDPQGRITHFVAVKKDITERLALEAQLAQAQKLEAIGQLAAGIAHEINTPTQYIGDNARFLEQAWRDLQAPLDRLRELVAAAEAGPLPHEAVAAARRTLQDADLDYLSAEVPQAIRQSLEGVARVTGIVRAMKNFSHPTEERVATDLNEAIDATITVATHEWKYVATVDRDFEAELPPVPCYAGEFNQVILNMIVNAAHAIADVVGESGAKGTITVRTRRDAGHARVEIEDTGCGIEPEHLSRVFDAFFTTKPVGRGTGQGLSIAHGVIVRKHGGSIDVRSEPGRGTCFIVRLPFDAIDAIDAPGGRDEPA